MRQCFTYVFSDIDIHDRIDMPKYEEWLSQIGYQKREDKPSMFPFDMFIDVLTFFSLLLHSPKYSVQAPYTVLDESIDRDPKLDSYVLPIGNAIELLQWDTVNHRDEVGRFIYASQDLYVVNEKYMMEDIDLPISLQEIEDFVSKVIEVILLPCVELSNRRAEFNTDLVLTFKTLLDETNEKELLWVYVSYEDSESSNSTHLLRKELEDNGSPF